MRIDKDLVAASATPLVLAILAEGESYGYALLKRVRDVSGGELEWSDGGHLRRQRRLKASIALNVLRRQARSFRSGGAVCLPA